MHSQCHHTHHQHAVCHMTKLEAGKHKAPNAGQDKQGTAALPDGLSTGEQFHCSAAPCASHMSHKVPARQHPQDDPETTVLTCPCASGTLMPKSVTFMRSAVNSWGLSNGLETRRLSGLMSRCTTPLQKQGTAAGQKPFFVIIDKAGQFDMLQQKQHARCVHETKLRRGAAAGCRHAATIHI